MRLSVPPLRCGTLTLQSTLPADPFADAAAEDSAEASKGKGYVHVRVQQRNGRKSLTTVQGISKSFDYKRLLKDFKKVRKKYK